MLARATGAITIVASLSLGPLAFTVVLLNESASTLALVYPVTLTLSSLAVGLISYNVERWSGRGAVMGMPILSFVAGVTAVLLMWGAGFFVLLLPMMALASTISVGLRTNWEGI